MLLEIHVRICLFLLQVVVDLFNVLETLQRCKPNLRLLCEEFLASLLEVVFKLVVVTSQVFIADPVVITGALELLDLNFLIEPHENELLNGVANLVVVYQLALSVFANLINNGLSQLIHPFLVDQLPENLQ